MNIEMWEIERVKPYPKNPRSNDAAVEPVATSIREFGFRQPLVVDAEGVVVVGHTRLFAAQKLGLKKVPVHIAKDLTPQQARSYRLADNRLGQVAQWNEELLKVELADLKAEDFDLGILGFGDDELAKLLGPLGTEGLTDPDEVPEPPDEPITKPGELWALGHHRLLCGDCTDPLQVRRVMDGQRAVLFATDPPYLVDYTGKNHPHKWNEPDKNKDWSDTYGNNWDEAAANPELYEKFIAAAVAEAIVPNAAWYCWHASRRQAMLESVWEKHGAFMHQQIIWAKDRPILTRSWYLWRHEPCFFGWVRPHKPPRMADDYPHSVWSIPTVKCGEKTDHPTSKPVEVFAIPMRQHTKVGDVCYEPFCGSGSQVIAAEQLGRRCYAIEISPVYCTVILQRWEKFTGKKAERIAEVESAPRAACDAKRVGRRESGRGNKRPKKTPATTAGVKDRVTG